MSDRTREDLWRLVDGLDDLPSSPELEVDYLQSQGLDELEATAQVYGQGSPEWLLVRAKLERTV